MALKQSWSFGVISEQCPVDPPEKIQVAEGTCQLQKQLAVGSPGYKNQINVNTQNGEGISQLITTQLSNIQWEVPRRWQVGNLASARRVAEEIRISAVLEV